MPDTNWTLISGSTPQDYTDTAVFEVDPDTKQIALITGQALVAGEKDSQYISFLMPRYWDGIDISSKTFAIEYALAGTYYGTSEAVNAEMTTEQVRFGWIVPETACAISGTLLFVIKITSEDYVLKTQIAEHPVFKTIRVEDVVPEPTKEAWYRDFQNRVDSAISEAETAVDTAQATLTQVEASVGLAQTAAQEAQTAEDNAEAAAASAQIRYGSPFVAQTADEMVEQNRVYVYTGSETGYTAGHWYYHNGTEWTDGGVYNGSAVNTDSTLTQSGMPADAKATGDEISQIKEDFTDMVNSAYVTDSASGGIAHFVDGADNVPVKSLKVNIEPVQSGSGDPSPENARPISGWDSVKVTGHGRNFCKCIVKTIKQNKNGLTATPNGDGSITINGTCTGTLVLYFNLATEGGDGIGTGQGNGMKNLPNGTYRFGALPSGVRLQIYGSDVPNATSADAHFISDSTRGTFTITGAYRYNWVCMSVSVDTVLDNATVYPALYLASDTDGTYEPYNGNTYDISLASAGTVYGGTLDAVSGVLTVDKAIVDLGTLTWTYDPTIPRFHTTRLQSEISPVNNSEAMDGLSTLYKVVSFNDLYTQRKENGSIAASNNKIVSIINTAYTDAQSFKTAMVGQTLVYPLATPLTYQLSATEIKSLLGINNVWSDAGDMDVEYRADTKLYIDKRLAEALA